MEELTLTMPAVALRGMTILPGMIAHFDVSRKKSLRAIEESMNNDQRIFLVTQRDVEKDNPNIHDLYNIGIVADIKQLIKLEDGVVRLLNEGTDRAKALAFREDRDYLQADVEVCQMTGMEELSEPAIEAMCESVKETFVRYASVNGHIGKETIRQTEEITKLDELIDYVGNNIPVRFADKQKILEAIDISQRYETLLTLLFSQMEILAIKREFQEKVKVRVDKNQKKYILREQMEVIREELGEDEESEADEFLKELEKLDAPDKVKEKIEKEIKRFRNIQGSSSESAVSRGYIEVLLSMPWNKSSVDNTNLDDAQKILEDEHYGLEKVKERILEFLAVRNLTSKGESPIICLVGPPGTGKTSIARSIAEALDKKYVRICLGGVRDEAEIRGHRRTYVGAMPGRIVNGLRSAGVNNPLMLLDEVDKVSSDYKGDTSAALLEVLDSEQNNKFRDHYLEIPVDLSEVLFIATANSAQDIPKPLLDRMEIIEVTSYTENEKFHIAKEHLVKKQLKRNGLKKSQLSINDAALLRIIHSYTREAGVRDLERKIGQICRKAARDIYQNGTESVKVKKSNLSDFLGKEKYSDDTKNDRDEVGIVRGLAWTSVGGVTLEIEVNIMPGKGEFLLTGKLGDVMKESAQAGISYIRSISDRYNVDEDFFSKHDIHIHIPEGAVPKDGPSAGITMATAMLSAIIDRPVRADIAMTGEITLRGRVLPIGGLKEKLLAAKNAGMKTVCIPFENKKDLEEISQEIIAGMEIIPVKYFDEVIKAAFVN